ncbi:hypothetical protein PED38_07665 [Clavibacter sp. CT19]|uniref:hypothetical protein n=1 Tax=Clavibacter sp. CT19 TaxID=3018990 RepID=UPI0022EA96BF|nr:hypothetical protein [Clavibacter sp. CT19]MDA3804670.1 hypothetical protein [Clavibacter sp. CT19]
MDRKPVPTWIAVLVLGVCEVTCFSLVRSEWSLVLFAVLTLGIAVVYRVVSRRSRR